MNDIKENIRRINSEIYGRKCVTFLRAGHSIAQQTLIVNLAIMYAQANEKTVIVDTDFSKSSFAKVFGVKPKNDLLGYMNEGGVDTTDILNKVPSQKVEIIVANRNGDSERRERFLTSDPKFHKLLESLLLQFDHVLINAPYYDNFDEVKGTLKFSDGVVLVLDIGQVKKRKLISMVNEIKQSKVEILGYVSAIR
ncbi:AAA family ATPase [Lactobacillus plantarum]|nr:AAA family ATPase [Lactiplantibacillus plantarum]